MTRPPRPCLAPGCGRLTRDGRCPRHDRGQRGRNGWEWQRIRQQVLDRDGYACRACGSTRDLSVHHITERQNCGPDTPDNLVVLCAEHHAQAHRVGGRGGIADGVEAPGKPAPPLAVRTRSGRVG